jgi:predicted RNA-binding Zn-ribbon protein involved in translation (DUF1610 family)
MEDRKPVEVRLAFAFTCPDCGAENFVKSVLHEFTAQEQEELADDLGEKPQTGSWITHPEEVACSSCGAKLHAFNPGEQNSKSNEMEKK